MDYPQINNAETLVLIRMEVAGTLQVWVEESQPSGSAPRLFHIAFPGEIMAFSTMNASYLREVEEGSYTGNGLRLYETSPFLDYVCSRTYVASTLSAPLHHFQVVTEETIVDVITISPPQVDEITL